MSDWRAVHCFSQQEPKALASLREVGLECWYPFRLVRRWHPVRRTTYRARVPYFPGYLFADLDSGPPPGKPAGVEAVLGDVAIPDVVMLRLMALADDDGRIIEPLLKPGDRVESILPGITVELVRLDRKTATVLVPLLGRLCTARMSAVQLLGA